MRVACRSWAGVFRAVHFPAIHPQCTSHRPWLQARIAYVHTCPHKTRMREPTRPTCALVAAALSSQFEAMTTEEPPVKGKSRVVSCLGTQARSRVLVRRVCRSRRRRSREQQGACSAASCGAATQLHAARNVHDGCVESQGRSVRREGRSTHGSKSRCEKHIHLCCIPHPCALPPVPFWCV